MKKYIRIIIPVLIFVAVAAFILYLPDISERKAQFFESRNYVKTARGKTMCQRMKYLFTEKYEFSDEFRSSAEFKEVLALLGDN